MAERTKHSILAHIEAIAYILAIWSFLVLFLEPVINFYVDYKSVELITALANILLLSLTILNKVFMGEMRSKKNLVIFDLMMLMMGGLLMFYHAKFVIFFLLIRQTYFILQFIIFRAFEDRKSVV